MARISYDNRTVLFGENEDMRITEHELATAIINMVNASLEDATDLAQVLIDGLSDDL